MSCTSWRINTLRCFPSTHLGLVSWHVSWRDAPHEHQSVYSIKHPNTMCWPEWQTKNLFAQDMKNIMSLFAHLKLFKHFKSNHNIIVSVFTFKKQQHQWLGWPIWKRTGSLVNRFQQQSTPHSTNTEHKKSKWSSLNLLCMNPWF